MSLILALLLYIGNLFAFSEPPEKILARRQMQAWPANFNLEETLYENREIFPRILAKVHTRFFGSIREYDLYGEGKKLLATAKHTIDRACTLFTVESPNEEYLGLIEEYPNYFKIYDDQDDLIATSKTNYWETKIELINPDGDLIGTLTRPLFREHDGWSLTLEDQSEWSLNKALWLLLPAIHTDRPFWQSFPFFHSQNPKVAF